ncbi:MAG: dTMP kinase [Candidatus Lokiarchaeota archaeon]
MNNPIFIVLDGIDGSGTSTHSKLLAGFLEYKGFKVHLTKEPSDSEIGILLRKFLKDPRIPPEADALLFAADRAYHFYCEIQKKLNEGYIVISDRYIESSIIYQSIQSENLSIEWVEEINKFVGKPDITFILDIDPAISLARKNTKDIEKFEKQDFLEKVRNLYRKRANKEGYILINSDNIIELVQDEIQIKLLDEFKYLASPAK